MFQKHAIFVLCVLMGLASGAQAKNHHDEEPQVVLSTDCVAALKKFRHIFDRYFFAVSADKKVCTYSYCQSGGCQRDKAQQLTVHRCERESGTDCKRYGSHKRVPELEGN